jgi:hypothetical protein
MIAQLVALIFAALSLIILFVRRSPSGAPSRPPVWLVPVAIIVGVLPAILQLSEAARRVGSMISMALSVTAIALLLLHIRRSRSSR